ncbi:MAG: class I SAM-dependent methyltransferase [Acidobacteria bacterium]|nr:class I SAM-dependent methyltransferase [Acidobacteriota bacterium]
MSLPFVENFQRLLRRVLGQEAKSLPAGQRPSAAPLVRHSNGLQEFWKEIQSPAGLQILDLGSASQANVSFITGLGHKLYTEDLIRTLQDSAPAEPVLAEQPSEEEQTSEEDRFFQENLKFTEGQFDGILCWDLFDFLADPLVKPLVERLHRSLKPGGTLLTFFHTGQAGHEVPLYQYGIQSEDTLRITGHGTGKLHHTFHNRAIENLFRRFASLKFYLSRDNLREVIIVR